MCRNWNSHQIPKRTNQHSLQKSSTDFNGLKNKTLRKQKRFWAQHLLLQEHLSRGLGAPKGVSSNSVVQVNNIIFQKLFTILGHHNHSYWRTSGVYTKTFNQTCPALQLEARHKTSSVFCVPPLLCWHLSRKVISECFCFTWDNCMFVPQGRWAWQPKPRERREFEHKALPTQLQFSLNKSRSSSCFASQQLLPNFGLPFPLTVKIWSPCTDLSGFSVGIATDVKVGRQYITRAARNICLPASLGFLPV